MTWSTTNITFTPAVERVLATAAQWGTSHQDNRIQSPELLLALLTESECLAAQILTDSGLSEALVQAQFPHIRNVTLPANAAPRTLSAELQGVLARAKGQALGYPEPQTLATEHVLLAILLSGDGTARFLAQHGLTVEEIHRRLQARHRGRETATPLVFEPPPGATPRRPVLDAAPLETDAEFGDSSPRRVPVDQAWPAGAFAPEIAQPPLREDPAPSALNMPRPRQTIRVPAYSNPRNIQAMSAAPLEDARPGGPWLSVLQTGQRALWALGVLRELASHLFADARLAAQLEGSQNRLKLLLHKPRPVENAAGSGYLQSTLGAGPSAANSAGRPWPMTRPAQVPALGTGMPSAPAFRSAVYSGIGGASPGWFAQQPHIAQEQAAWQAAWAEHLSALLADGYTLTVVGPLAQATLADPLQALFQEWQQLPQTPVPQQGKRFRLQAARLYVLIDGQRSPAEFEALVRQLITAGVHVLQLRDKQLTDAALIDRARRLRALSWQTQALFIMNDRPDIAALVQADGVHVGQEEMELADVRTLCGPEMLIGVSTHTLGQAQQAASGGADYVGVGPTFESGTKRFSNFPGLELVRQVSQHLTLPAFAIGGIHAGNVTSVLQAGLRRIAVSAAVVGAQNPAQAATELLRLLHV